MATAVMQTDLMNRAIEERLRERQASPATPFWHLDPGKSPCIWIPNRHLTASLESFFRPDNVYLLLRVFGGGERIQT